MGPRYPICRMFHELGKIVHNAQRVTREQAAALLFLVIGMATTCADKSGAVPRSHSEWSVVIGSRLMARSAGI